MAGDIKLKYGTASTVTITLASLASGSARASAAIDNSSNLYEDYLFLLKWKTASGSPVAPKIVNVWACASTDDGTTYTEGATGSDAAITLTSPTNALFVGSINCPAGATTYIGGPWSIKAAFGGSLPKFFVLLADNQSGVAGDATESNFAKLIQGVYHQYT